MVRGLRTRRSLAAVAIFLTAIALQQATTRPWGGGRASDGSRYELSAVGLSHLQGGDDAIPGAASSRTDCRWWPVYGDPVLCGVRQGGEAAYGRLRLAYPALQVAMWLAVASLLLQTLRIPRQRALQGAVPLAACALSAAGMFFVTRDAPLALGALQHVELGFRGSGFLWAVAAVVFSGASALVLLSAPEPPPPTA